MVRNKQKALASVLESMTDKVDTLMVHLPHLETELQGANRNISTLAVRQAQLRSVLRVLRRTFLKVKKSVDILLDPRVGLPDFPLRVH